MKRTSLVLAAFLLLLATGLAACGEGDETPAVGEQLSVEEFAFSQLEDGSRIFTGQLYNASTERVQQVQIGVSLLDGENRRVGTTTIAVSDIAPEDTTSFRQMFDSSQEVSGVRVSSLTVL